MSEGKDKLPEVKDPLPKAEIPIKKEGVSTERADAALQAFMKEDEKKKEPAVSQDSNKGKSSKVDSALFRSVSQFFRNFFKIGDMPGIWGRLLMGFLCLAIIFTAWFLATRPWWGPNGNERAIDNYSLGSPEEVWGSFRTLWFDRALTRNLMISLWRIIQGFGLAVLVGVPIGILCGAFRRIDAFFAPISLFGRNVPVVALAPLVMCFVGLGEPLKVTFLFIACVAFVMFDSSRAISDVREEYLDTAYTLGASRWQALTKVMIPLALPSIFNSIRLLFGLAFGYLMVVEMLDMDSGAGFLILTSQKRGPREHIVLLLLFITAVAYLLDRFLFFIQRTLFAYRYGRR